MIMMFIHVIDLAISDLKAYMLSSHIVKWINLQLLDALQKSTDCIKVSMITNQYHMNGRKATRKIIFLKCTFLDNLTKLNL